MWQGVDFICSLLIYGVLYQSHFLYFYTGRAKNQTILICNSCRHCVHLNYSLLFWSETMLLCRHI